MRLLFKRHGGALMIGELPAALWSCEDLEHNAKGHAGVLEIVPIPSDPELDNSQLRRLLASELTTRDPTMYLAPTPNKAMSMGTAARQWLGIMGSGLPVCAFIGVVTPINAAMDRLLREALEDLPVTSMEIDNSLPDRIAVDAEQALR